MNWEISFDDTKNMILIKIDGEIRAVEVAKMAFQGLAIARQKDCHKCLIDTQQSLVKDSTTESFAFMSNLPRLGLKQVDRIAVVYSQSESQHSFGELVAHNRGWENIRYFREMDKALEWLATGSEQ